MIVSCSLSLKDGQPESQPISLEGPGANCMDRAILSLGELFSGDTTSAEIDAAWTCIAEALVTFKTHVRGQEGNVYSANELRSFIERYFLTSHKISDGLLTEIMRVKQSVLGGEIETLTRSELDQADVVLKTLRAESVKMLPFMKMLILEADRKDLQKQPEFVERGISQLVSTANTLGTLLGKSRASYRFSDADRLFREFERLSTKAAEARGPASIVEYLPTVSAFKAFFVRPGADAVAPEEWLPLISGAGRLYGMYLRYDYFISDKSLTGGDGLKQIVRIANELMTLVDNSIRVKEGQVIRFREIDGLVEQLYKLKILDLPFKESTAKQLFRDVLQKACNPAFGNGRIGVVEGLTAPTFEWLKSDFFGWAEIQQAWDQIGGGTKEVAIADVRKRLKAVKFANVDSAEEIQHLVDRSFPLSFTPIGTVKLSPPDADFTLNQDVWTSLNWKRVFVRVALRAFATNYSKERFIGLKKTQFKAFYDDLYDVATELNLLDPRDPDLWDSLFDEANIFMLSADGDDRLSFSEGVDVLSFALSSSQIARPTYQDMRDNCRNFEPDVYGLPMLDVHCYRQRFHDNFRKYYELIPGWVRMVSRIPGDKFFDFQKTLETAARHAGAADVHMESGDIDKSTMLFHYIESLFTRFDANRSDTFSVEESMKAYPLLRPILQEVSGFTDEEELEALYTYVIRYGVSPKDNIWAGLRFLWWKPQRGSWKYEADRWQILKVIANLQTARNKIRNP